MDEWICDANSSFSPINAEVNVMMNDAHGTRLKPGVRRDARAGTMLAGMTMRY
jgi:hypothetical protein